MLSLPSSFRFEMSSLAVARPGTIVILIAIFTLPNLETSSARSLGLNEDIWSSVSKRNSWWSKKSVLPVPDYPQLNEESPYAENMIEKTTNSERPEPYSHLFSCYVQDCVPTFIHCVQTSPALAQRTVCKRQHEMCADLCGALRTEDVLQ